MKSKEQQLFLAVEKGKTSKIETLLAQGVDINARDDRDGSTPLIRAGKGRNYVVQKLLLSNGADPKLRDKFGLTPLHYVAESGDVESLKLIVAMGAPIDAKDLAGCSPLHYSVDRGRVSATDMLLFCGADVSCTNRKGQSPLSVGRQGRLRFILENGAAIHEGIINGDIKMDHVELEPNKRYVLEHIDLEIETGDNFSASSLSFLCQRRRPEYCSNKQILPKDRELLMSDIFEYRTSSTRFSSSVRIGVPMHAYPEPYEDVYLKSERGVHVEDGAVNRYTGIKRNERWKGKLRWTCMVNLDITKVKTFVLVTRPRVEYFDTGPSANTFYSEVDKFLQIKVQPNTFKSGKISLEVIQSPIYKEEDFKDVLSVGHFYDMNHDSHVGHFNKDGVNFTMPIPNDFDGEGELCILGANISSDYDYNRVEDKNTVLERWEIIERNMNPRRGRISCGLSHFSIYVPMERRGYSSDEVAKINADNLLKRSMKRKSFLKFFVLSKPGKRHHDAVVECISPQKVADRINHWMSLGYLKNMNFNSESGDIETMDRQEYELEIFGNIKSKFDFPCIRLQFHAKRENYQNLQLTVIDREEDAMGYLYVFPKEVNDVKRSPLLNLPITLYDSMVNESVVHDEKGFLSDSFLHWIANKLGSPAWIQVCVFLGLSFQTIEDYRTQPTTPRYNTEDKIFKILREWREKCRNRDDRGLPDLVLALRRVDRHDLHDKVLQDLQEWLQKEKVEKDAFYQWAQQSIQSPNFKDDIQEEEVEPMSDTFLVLLVHKYGEKSFRHIGIDMDLNENQISNIMEDSTIPNMEMKWTRILRMARDKLGDDAIGFEMLTNALLDWQLMEAREWVINTARKWCGKDSKKATKFKLDIMKVLDKLEGKVTESDSEKDEEQDIPSSENEVSNDMNKEDGQSDAVVDQHNTEKEFPSHSQSEVRVIDENNEDETNDSSHRENSQTHENNVSTPTHNVDSELTNDIETKDELKNYEEEIIDPQKSNVIVSHEENELENSEKERSSNGSNASEQTSSTHSKDEIIPYEKIDNTREAKEGQIAELEGDLAKNDTSKVP